MAKKDLKEFKASFGVRAEVPEPTAKRVVPPGGSASGEEDHVVTSPTAVKPSKGAAEIAPVNGSKGPGAEGEKDRPKQGSSEVKQPPQVTKEDIDVGEDLAAMFNFQKEGVILETGGESAANCVVTKLGAGVASVVIKLHKRSAITGGSSY